MCPFWRLALAPALFLFACAQAPPPAPPVVCQTGTAEELLAAMAQTGVETTVDLETAKAQALAEWIIQFVDAGHVPPGIDRALIFVNGDKVLIIWVGQGCLLGRLTGPWAPVARWLEERST